MQKLMINSLVVMMVACASVSTTYDYDKTADFSKYKTYGWAPHVSELKVNQLDKDRVTAAIDREMKSRGYTESSSNPDLLIDLHTKVQQEESATATTMGPGMGYGGWGYGFGGGFSTTTVDIDKYNEGTLFINVIDNAQQKIIWQGRGTKTLSENIAPDKKEANINNAVAAIYEKYPVHAPGK